MRRHLTPTPMELQKTRMPTHEQRLSTEAEIAAAKAPSGAPSLRDLKNALDVIVQFQLNDTSSVQPCNKGDLFFQYDLSIGTHERPVFRIRDRRTLHDALTKQGAPSALEAFELVMLELMRPLKTRVSVMVNDVLSENDNYDFPRLK